MTRGYGRTRRGRRVCAKVPYRRCRTTTSIAGLRYDGIIAPFVVDGPIDGASSGVKFSGGWYKAMVQPIQ
jgi:hypothetical protein